jgi:predicted amidohydrolase YtcJ
MKPHSIPLLAAAALGGIATLLFSCRDGAKPAAATGADTIFHNGSILTMAGKEPAYVEALAVKDGRIVFAGSKDEALKLKNAGTTLQDLGGKHLMPSFMDGHGHFINALSLAGQAN